ncbi:two-component system sensor histidine kinase RppB [Nodosilinea sp. PGN35]|uniref:two-component system sensor histidine kinase RppB n=1 Tax=unclassified Nodosilinea TaxID=2628167 RepID=UPI000D1363B5|nr:two-component system sensor histidine kinase RppB [Nodosilinea sp. TSF1-S3]MDF0368402.1 HAMP domain-containing sensor histidine kinase [Nodosilinea sp. TSF1-S3]PSN11619.1 two-component sensor histidine kinase [filamentous cyanobacterium CCT1]PSN77929.1 two-component sensor histidine kinase [filamentous cyanobacterium CCP4]
MAWDTGSKLNRLFRRSRWQLTGWYTGVMAVVLAISAVGMYEAIAHAHRVAADRELKSVAEAVHDSLEKSLTTNGQLKSDPSDLLPNLCLTGDPCLAPFEHSGNHYHPDDLYSSNYYIQVLDIEGAVITTAGNYPPGLSNSDPSSIWQTRRDRSGQPYRQVSLPLYALDNQQPLGQVVVGRSLSDFATYLATIRWNMALALPIAMALIAGAGWWLAGVALEPVRMSYRNIQQFTADAAHELRTPLSAVQATTESVIRLPHISDAEARDTLQVIARQNHRLARLVSDLLLLSRLDIQTSAPGVACCLQDLLADIEEEMAALAIAKGIDLLLDQPATPPLVVIGHEEQLHRLVLNLVSNALQHTPANGKVVIRLRALDKYVLITVEDTGVGIHPDDQSRIFDRFYRIEKDRSRQSGGAGLGLSIALAIAQAHGGSIHVKSAVSKGSTFTIKLPLASAGMPLGQLR